MVTMSRSNYQITLTILVAILLLAAVFVGFGWMDRHIKNARSGPVHSFQMNPLPAFVSDDLALTKAREVMTADGYDMSVWRPHEDDRTMAPDGTKDKYFVRNAIRPNDGFVLFQDPTLKQSNPQRIIRIELDRKSVV